MYSLAPQLSSIDRIWKGKDSLETFTLEQHNSGFIGGGIVSAGHFKIRYQVYTDLQWEVLKVRVENLDRPGKLCLIRGAYDLWFDEKGREVAELAGCREVDISATPFTNTIALQKLYGLKENILKVAYIHVPDLRLTVVEQVYTKLAAGKYNYENRNTQFSSELLVDQYGLVVDYPGLFKML